MGMAVYYVSAKEKCELFSLNLASNINNLVADEFGFDSALLWDSQAKALRLNKHAKSLVEEVSKKGFSACHEFKNGGAMTKTLLEVVASEHLY
jgi:hypothetical protein